MLFGIDLFIFPLDPDNVYSFFGLIVLTEWKFYF